MYKAHRRRKRGDDDAPPTMEIAPMDVLFSDTDAGATDGQDRFTACVAFPVNDGNAPFDEPHVGPRGKVKHWLEQVDHMDHVPDKTSEGSRRLLTRYAGSASDSNLSPTPTQQQQAAAIGGMACQNRALPGVSRQAGWSREVPVASPLLSPRVPGVLLRHGCAELDFPPCPPVHPVPPGAPPLCLDASLGGRDTETEALYIGSYGGDASGGGWLPAVSFCLSLSAALASQRGRGRDRAP